ncbi:hypothetical protein [Chitinophaga pinensis]|uniref:Uncharacterized protein n=1 Tax=Chitinophaga pinensis TaxID=79329 RepID=A0A5C6LUP0_9BACT|nr:hypothetical protein [Chitinophaga pinensis]TWV99458.1 hypothetical protein FEF09_15830 [Chitinophaga pinensis]
MSVAADSSMQKAEQLPGKYLSEVKKKSDRVEHQVNKRADKALSRLLRQEKKMKARLWKVDSVAAKNIFTKSIDSLGSLKSGLKGKVMSKLPMGNSYLDSLGSSLKFLEGKGNLLGASKDKLAGATGSLESLQGKLQQADQIKAYIREHKKELKEQLSKYTVSPKTCRRSIRKLITMVSR